MKFLICFLVISFSLAQTCPPHSVSDSSLSYCCPESCGKCGGSGCDQRLGGYMNCCSSNITKSCSYNGPPCKLEKTYKPSPNRCPMGGIIDATNTKCCPASCGSCGGSGCHLRPGGDTKCCTGNVSSSCSSSKLPCSLDGPAPPHYPPPLPPISKCPVGAIPDSSGMKCCPAMCGVCGGYGCDSRPGGAMMCCTGRVNLPCSTNKPPCVALGDEPTKPPTKPDSKCPIGTIIDSSGSVCCPASCGACGGYGCDNRPGGDIACCTGRVIISCSMGKYPCRLNGAMTPLPTTPEPTPTPTPSTPTPTPSTPTPTPSTPTDNSYSIQLVNFGEANAEIDLLMENAKKQWESVIVGDVPDITKEFLNLIGLKSLFFDRFPTDYIEAVDDIVIGYKFDQIDGEGNVAGVAGPTLRRPDTNLPIAATMVFDIDDVDRLTAEGSFESVILHEMGHSLGFVDPWDQYPKNCGVSCNKFDNGGTSDCNASKEFKKVFSGDLLLYSVGESGDGSFCSHWDEDQLGDELMTPRVAFGKKSPLTAITIGAFEDIGYEVSYASAEDVNSISFSSDNVSYISEATSFLKRRKLVDSSYENWNS